MAVMYPKEIEQYANNESEKFVYYELQRQLPDEYQVFYSVEWQQEERGRLVKSEADFVVVHPTYGFLCLEVKGGRGIRVDNNIWYIDDGESYGERRLTTSPYSQAEKSMYYFEKVFRNAYNTNYPGIFGAVVVFPFYAIANPEKLSNRDKACTIDSNSFSSLQEAVKKAYKHWGGARYGHIHYSKEHHHAFIELIKKKVAISAAAGALIKYKEPQFEVINRVQDNYIYFLKNIRQFYVRGGAGTGKTWIALKMTKKEAMDEKKKVLYLCASVHLVQKAREYLGNNALAKDIRTLLSESVDNFSRFQEPLFEGISKCIKSNAQKYDAIFIDEAQDFTEEWAHIVRLLLKDEKKSRLGIFYDDVQIVRKDSFGDAFMIDIPPFLLRENIRNTANIYRWAMEKTQLGTDVITNPVEGPIPVKEIMADIRHLTHRMENLFKEYIDEEHLENTSLTVLLDDEQWFRKYFSEGLAKWIFVSEYTGKSNEIKIASVENFKGLESDMIIYIHSGKTNNNLNYIAYTRAKYYLLELVVRE